MALGGLTRDNIRLNDRGWSQCAFGGRVDETEEFSF